MNRSLRSVLLATLLPTVTLIWAVTAALSYHDARNEIAELFDAEMAQSARFLLALANSGRNPDTLDLAKAEQIVLASDAGELEHRYEKKLARQIWQGRERLLLRTADAPLEPLGTTENGYSVAEVAGTVWHVYTLGDTNGRFSIHIGQSADVREKITDDITRDLLLQFLIGVPLISTLISLGVERALRPLDGLVREVEKRGDDLLTPLSTLERLPLEVTPLVRAFNKLLHRLALAFDNERRFTADAAHELRTPLAGIQTQADVALRTHDEDTRGKALKQIKSGVQRMDHLVGQLLVLARLDPESGLFAPRPVDLSDVVLYAVGELDNAAQVKNQRIKPLLAARKRVTGHPQMLEMLARNLLDNAIRYTPRGGIIRIAAEDLPAGACLIVEDSGPGIPPEAREQVFHRFYRQVETAYQQSGSGLGLSIVERIARLHGASIELDTSPWGGLKATVVFPAVAAAKRGPHAAGR